MCIGSVTEEPYGDKEIIKMAAAIMEAREEGSYAKGIRAYGAWKDMLLDEKWFENGTGFDEMFSKLLVQNDAMVCIGDGRKWGAGFFEELSEKKGSEEKKYLRAERQRGDGRIESAEYEDTKAYEQIKMLLERI